MFIFVTIMCLDYHALDYAGISWNTLLCLDEPNSTLIGSLLAFPSREDHTRYLKMGGGILFVCS